MNLGKFVFAQVFDLIHPQPFHRCVARYDGNYKTKTFSCWSQFLCVGFGQLTFRESLREIEVCLNSRGAQLYHLGWSGPISRSTLADANHGRDWRIYSDLAQGLIRRARRLYQDEPLAGDLKETVYALDSTTIDLCLGLFPWARFRPTKSAIKLHTVLDLRGSIPTAITITEGKRGDVRLLDDLILEAGSLYIICVYVLVAIVKKTVKSNLSLTTIIQILSVNAFEKVPLAQLLAEMGKESKLDNPPNQLTFNY